MRFTFKAQEVLVDSRLREPLFFLPDDVLVRSRINYANPSDTGSVVPVHQAVLVKEGIAIPPGAEFVPVRSMIGVWAETILESALRGLHLSQWRENAETCGRCGTSLTDSETDSGRVCPACGFILYPRISPAVVVKITKGDTILLAKNVRGRGQIMSHIAGFVEPGESLEETARREIMEEVGLSVGDLKYEGSQPWPFPDSLMVGFSSEWKGGDIACDKTEIERADWFTRDLLPELPMFGSLSRRMIDDWIARLVSP